MKTTSELAAQIVGSNSKNSIDDFKAELARVKAILDAHMSESRTSNATSELARETARKLDADDVLTFDDQVATIKSTLDAQSA